MKAKLPSLRMAQQVCFDVAARQTADTALKDRVPISPGSAAELASTGGLTGLVLYLELRRWEADAPMRISFVIVGLEASLVDPSVVTPPRPSRPPRGIRVESAYVTAARKIMAQCSLRSARRPRHAERDR